LKPRNKTGGEKTEQPEDTAMRNWDQQYNDLMQVQDAIYTLFTKSPNLFFCLIKQQFINMQFVIAHLSMHVSH